MKFIIKIFLMGVCHSTKNITSNTFKTGKTSNVLEVIKTKSEIGGGVTHLSTRKSTVKGKDEIIVNSELIVGYSSCSPQESYKIVKKLGEGSYGIVWKVRHIETGLYRAMKKINKSSGLKRELEKDILNEISLLKKMDHPNIVKIFESFNSPDGYYLITEFCDGGELFDAIKQKKCFSEAIAANIMYQIFSAVNYCHKCNNIIHRDLKPENILIESIDGSTGFYNIKIIDFGTAKIYEKNKNECKVIGSSYYIAPEVLNKNYNEKCDLWSCGVILYILLSGHAPFSGEKDSDIIMKIRAGKYDMSRAPFDKISSQAKDMIKKLLQMNPKNRLSADQALKHSWFKELKTKKYFCEVNELFLKNCLANIKKHTTFNKLQQVVLAYLVHNLPDIDEIKLINKVFTLFNTNSDGKLTKEEVKAGLTKYLFQNEKNKKAIEMQVDEIFERIDNDGNGYIEFEEFARAGIDKEIFMDKEILQFAFNFLDKDHSEEITFEEIKEVFCVGDDSEESAQQLKDIIAMIDTDGNGNISFKEFEDMMKQILK